MKKTFIATILLAIMLIAGCSTQNTAQEEITSIVIERYGMFTMQEYAFQKITITQEGILYETYYANMTKTGEEFTPFAGNEFEKLTTTLKEIDFEHLKNTYTSETPVADVGGGNIIVTYGSSTKTIKVDPFISMGNPEDIATLIESIQETTSNASFPHVKQQETVTLRYEGKQCEDEPWESWYVEGNIQYIERPTSTQLILDYYASKGVGIYDIRSLNHEAVCEACGVCSDSEYYEIDVYNDQVEEFENEGWSSA